MAGGGRLKGLSVAEAGETSLPWISVEAAGVGGRLVRGMIGLSLASALQESDLVACRRRREVAVNDLTCDTEVALREGFWLSIELINKYHKFITN